MLPTVQTIDPISDPLLYSKALKYDPMYKHFAKAAYLASHHDLRLAYRVSGAAGVVAMFRQIDETYRHANKMPLIIQANVNAYTDVMGSLPEFDMTPIWRAMGRIN